MYSHYVPRFILKKFSDKLSLYNIHTGELAEDIKVDKAYSQKGFYDDDTEKNLNLKLESQFGNLLANKLLKAENIIELNRTEFLNLLNYYKIRYIYKSFSMKIFRCILYRQDA